MPNIYPNTKYPGEIDDATSIPEVTEFDVPSNLDPERFNVLGDAVKAIEGQLGSVPGGSSTVGERLDYLESLQNLFVQLGGDLGGSSSAPVVTGFSGVPIIIIPTLNNNQVLFYNSALNAWTNKFINIDVTRPPFTPRMTSVENLILELGQELSQPSFTAEYTEVASKIYSATLEDSDNGYLQNVITSPNSFSSSFSFSKISFNHFVDFTLTSSTKENPLILKTHKVTFTWGQKVYWGVSEEPVLYDQDFIKGLELTTSGGSEVTLTKNRSINVVAGSGEYIYYCFRSDFESIETAGFLVNDFEGGFTRVAENILVTNNYGVTEEYSIYRSDNPSLGSTNVIIF